MKVINISKDTILCDSCRLANTFMSRFMGLMGIRSFREGMGLAIRPCNSIHMFFMKIPLDIIFLDRNNTVLHIIENIKPWNISRIIRNSYYVLEIPAGTIAKTCTAPGDLLEWIETEI